MLEIEADGFANASGHAYARLYRPGDKVTGTPWRIVRAEVVGKRAHFQFSDLAFGDYALVVHHDVNGNGNGEIDHNLFGLPSEPLGFSNGFTLVDPRCLVAPRAEAQTVTVSAGASSAAR